MERHTKPELERMQRDAKERLKEMQRRSTQYDLNTEIPPVPNFVQVNNQKNRQKNTGQNPTPDKVKNETPPILSDKKEGKTNSSHQGVSRKKGFDLLKLFNFNNFKLDNDILVIVVLMLLLSSEEADELLLLALVYIML